MRNHILSIFFAFAAVSECAIAAVFSLPPGVSANDYAFDANSKTLFIAANNGKVLRFDTTLHEFLTPIEIGGDVRSIDVTSDGSGLFVAQGRLVSAAPDGVSGAVGIV